MYVFMPKFSYYFANKASISHFQPNTLKRFKDWKSPVLLGIGNTPTQRGLFCARLTTQEKAKQTYLMLNNIADNMFSNFQHIAKHWTQNYTKKFMHVTPSWGDVISRFPIMMLLARKVITQKTKTTNFYKYHYHLN